MLHRRDSIAIRLVDAFFRNLGIFLLCVVGVSSIVATALLVRSQSYTASASIRVLGNTSVTKLVGPDYREWESPAQIHATRFNDSMQDLRQDGFVNTVLATAKLAKPISTDPVARDPRFAKFRKNVFANANSKELLSIGLTWDDRNECERLVKAIQDSFIEDTGAMKQAEAVATVTFLDSEIEKYRKRLQEAEDALMLFKRQNAGRLPEAQEAEIERLADLRIERDFLLVTAQDFVLKRQTVEDRLKQIKPETMQSRTIGADPLIGQIQSLEGKKHSKISDGYTLDSDAVKGIDEQIATLRAELERKQKLDPTASRNNQLVTMQENPEYRTLTEQLTLLTMDERAHSARIAQMNQRINEAEKRMALLPVAQRTLVEKTRDRAVIEKQFESLLEQREQARLKASVDKLQATTKLIPQAVIHAEPTLGTAKKLILIAASIVLGFVVGCVMILVREWMDVSLRYTTDTERFLGVPVLAALPATPDLQFPLSTSRHGLLRARKNGRTPILPAPPEAK